MTTYVLAWPTEPSPTPGSDRVAMSSKAGPPSAMAAGQAGSRRCQWSSLVHWSWAWWRVRSRLVVTVVDGRPAHARPGPGATLQPASKGVLPLHRPPGSPTPFCRRSCRSRSRGQRGRRHWIRLRHRRDAATSLTNSHVVVTRRGRWFARRHVQQTDNAFDGRHRRYSIADVRPGGRQGRRERLLPDGDAW